jgi:phenylalanyl-tRNA synthetase alpha chain
MLQQKLQEIYEKALQCFLTSKTRTELYDFKVKYMGKNGELTALMKLLVELPKEERPQFGQLVNDKKNELELKYNEKEQELAKQELSQKIANETVDLTMPGPGMSVGRRHPIDLVINEMIDILIRIGFSVRTGPMIEHDHYNFEALNFPKDHPARDMQDTFYIDDEHVLRTHTSPIQVRTLENETLPLRILAPGSVFRCDSDITHSPNFYQVEGLWVDKKVSMAHLKGVVSFFIKSLFGEKIKIIFRPSFFPFTEPSAEVDCTCPICVGKGCRVCKQTGWIEIGGCGLVNPNVLKLSGVNPDDWQGFAFGFGVERMAMIRYGISDIRLFNENDLRFLEQF